MVKDYTEQTEHPSALMRNKETLICPSDTYSSQETRLTNALSLSQGKLNTFKVYFLSLCSNILIYFYLLCTLFSKIEALCFHLVLVVTVYSNGCIKMTRNKNPELVHKSRKHLLWNHKQQDSHSAAAFPQMGSNFLTEDAETTCYEVTPEHLTLMLFYFQKIRYF